MFPAPVSHNSVCPKFCLGLGRTELLRIKKVGLPGAQRVELENLWWGWGHQSGSWESGMNGLQSKATSLSHWHPWVCLNLYTMAHFIQTWAPQATVTGNSKGGASLKLVLIQCGRGNQHESSGCCPFHSLPRTTNPNYLHMILVHSSLPLLESRVGGYKWYFSHWPFKGVVVSLADSYLSLSGKILTDFYSQMLCGCLFPTLVLWAWEPSLGVRPYPLQQEPLQLRYPSGISATAHKDQGYPFCIFIVPTSFILAFPGNLWL